jgi:phosphate transport system substrate-binding protein
LYFIVLAGLLIGCTSTPSSSSSNQNSGTYIQNKGSDTMVNLALAWAERFQQENPAIQLSVTGGGSGTGITALINGTVDIANASREMKPEEIQKAKDLGFTPEPFVVAKDAIAVIVNPENPIDTITLEQLSQIYKGLITNWNQLGGDDRPIVAVSRESNSGTHVYFLETVIRLGNNKDKSIFAPTVLLLPSSEGIISEVRDNPNAIGYDGLGYVTSEVKLLAVAKGSSNDFVIPSADTVNNKTYPISRDLYMYTHGTPQGIILEYINWCMSSEGQAIVKQLGFVPIGTGK